MSWYSALPSILKRRDVLGLQKLLKSMKLEEYHQNSGEILWFLFEPPPEQNHMFVPFMLEFDQEGMLVVCVRALSRWLSCLENPKFRTPPLLKAWRDLLDRLDQNPNQYQVTSLLQQAFVSNSTFVCEALLSHDALNKWEPYQTLDMALRCCSPSRLSSWGEIYEKSISGVQYIRLWEKLLTLPMNEDQDPVDPTVYIQWHYSEFEQEEIRRGCENVIQKMNVWPDTKPVEWIKEALEELDRSLETKEHLQRHGIDLVAMLERRLLSEAVASSMSSASSLCRRKL